MIRTLQPSAVTHEGQEGSAHKKPFSQESALGRGKGTSVMT